MDPSDADYFWRQGDEEQARWEKAGKYIPTQDDIDEIAALLGRRKDVDDTEPIPPALLPHGIAIHTFSHGLMVVYWEGDPRVRVVMGAPIAELPKFLVHPDPDVRTLARWCLDEVT